MGKTTTYTNEEWVAIVNRAVRYLRTHAEADGTYIGSLKDAMSDFMAREIPDAQIQGSSLAATLPLTGLVSNGGRSGGHTIWSIASGTITTDDWVRLTYLRRSKIAESKGNSKIKPGPFVPPAAPKVVIDDSLTGHPEVVIVTERDYKAELEEARGKIEELLEQVEIESERRKELERQLAESDKDRTENIRLRGLLRTIALDPNAIDLFRAGMDLGSN